MTAEPVMMPLTGDPGNADQIIAWIRESVNAQLGPNPDPAAVFLGGMISMTMTIANDLVRINLDSRIRAVLILRLKECAKDLSAVLDTLSPSDRRES